MPNRDVLLSLFVLVAYSVFFSVLFSRQTKDQTVLLSCQALQWKTITNSAWGAWILSPVHLHFFHVYLWCPMSCCLITKCPPACLLHPFPLRLSPSPITPEGNSGTTAYLLFVASSLEYMFYFTSCPIWLLLHVYLFQPGVDCCPRISVFYLSLIM